MTVVRERIDQKGKRIIRKPIQSDDLVKRAYYYGLRRGRKKR